MTRKYLDTLIEKYILKTATLEEQRELQDWFDAENNREIVWSLDMFEEEVSVKARMLSKINERTIVKPSAIRLWPRIAAVASIVLVLGGSLFFYRYLASGNLKGRLSSKAAEISPGRNSATLTLADGKRIILSNKGHGQLAKEAGVIISKAADGQIVYQISGSNENKNTNINTLSTANGETYTILLPDSSKVWLNAASSLKYPSNFAALKNREVFLTGEGYFEVAKDKRHPFIVHTLKQAVEVLGTHFNVSSYAQDILEKTTLLEGSVNITTQNATTKLKSGEQAQTGSGNTVVTNEIDVEEAVAWKNGYFYFKSADLKTIMRQISRWYDVDVEYRSEPNSDLFYAEASRNIPVSELFKILKSSGIDLSIEKRIKHGKERRVIIVEN